ncbi:Transposase [Caenorhabditis elegans]|nr:Transposase [Caenorhabditis elegans]CDO41136.1 Transposase [Caenorhabditis elegans]|eukprot:NP_001294063.1 Uncharacterized protein CELE_F42A9.8 [Caenorhabditis elegans]
MRTVMRGATQNGSRLLDYDSIAEFFANSEFRALKDFFPERVRFDEIESEILPTRATGPSNSS